MVLVKSSISKVQQIVNALTKEIVMGTLKLDDQLPSINEFSQKNRVARDTVERAYKDLRSKGYIVSCPGRGYFVLYQKRKQKRVLLIFNRLSSFKKIIYENMVANLGGRASVDLQIHHYNPKILKAIIEENVGKYDYYVIMPHFYSGASEKEYLEIIRMVPPHQLILLDKELPQLKVPHKAVFQDFKGDIISGLQALAEQIRKYNSITIVLPEDIHHPKEIVEGITAFCNEQKVRFFEVENLEGRALKRKSVYIVTDEDNLAELLKRIRKTKLVLGSDIGVISFNETVFKELLDITVVSTDFEQMGMTAAELILKKEFAVTHNPFRVIPRGSL
jgi:DNA-binding transcriptional regulator YhcF (GntR family)/ribosomal protein L7Ae-like RNA K-turn-binding protein